MQDNRPAAPGLQDHPGRHRNGRKDQRQKLRMLGNGDATAKEMKRIIREHLILPAGLLLYRRTPFWLVKPGNPIEQAPSCACPICGFPPRCRRLDRKSTRLNSSHDQTSYAVFCLKKKKTK